MHQVMWGQPLLQDASRVAQGGHEGFEPTTSGAGCQTASPHHTLAPKAGGHDQPGLLPKMQFGWASSNSHWSPPPSHCTFESWVGHIRHYYITEGRVIYTYTRIACEMFIISPRWLIDFQTQLLIDWLLWRAIILLKWYFPQESRHTGGFETPYFNIITAYLVAYLCCVSNMRVTFCIHRCFVLHRLNMLLICV